VPEDVLHARLGLGCMSIVPWDRLLSEISSVMGITKHYCNFQVSLGTQFEKDKHWENSDALIWVENVLKNRTTFLSLKFWIFGIYVHTLYISTNKLWVQSVKVVK